MTKLTVLIPVFNEESTILKVLTEVGKQKMDRVQIETIVIDDGSTDGTRRLLGEASGLYEKLILLDKNRGKGAAIRAGLEAATGEYVIIQDADLEYSPKEYATVMGPALEHDADLVIGSRFLAPQMTRVFYYWHRVGNKFITFIFNLFNNTTFTDIYSGFVLFRRSLVNAGELRTSGWEQQAEILSIILRRSRSNYEVSINYFGRTYDEGKKIRAHHAAVIIWTIVRQRLSRLLGAR